jgi:hypothetical protein
MTTFVVGVSAVAGATSLSTTLFSSTVPGTYVAVVPSNVDEIEITAIGGTGGSDTFEGFPGGSGAIVRGAEAVTPGDDLAITIGANGTDGSNGSPAGAGGLGSGSGGAGGGPYGYAAGGGGASEVDDEYVRLVVAGAGGGAGTLGSGGSAGEAGTSVDAYCNGGGPGQGAIPGGAGGCPGDPGQVNLAAQGGMGDVGGDGGGLVGDGGGGGGGGWYGGGGSDVGGGGGGSSYPAADVVGLDATATPSVTIAYGPPSTPTISTTPSTTGTSTGATLQDQATLSNTGALDGTGSITFNLYGPTDPGDCSTTPVYTETVNGVASDGPFSTTTGYVATAAGTYNWTATYTGDGNDTAVNSSCGAEAVTVIEASQAEDSSNSIDVAETTPPSTVTSASTASGDLLSNAQGLAGDPSSITSVSDAKTPAGVAPSSGQITIDGAFGTLAVQTTGPHMGSYLYTLDSGVVPSCSGESDSFTYTLTDGYGQSSSANLEVSLEVSCSTVRPSVKGLSTDMGPVTGGTPITVTGSGFSSGATVAISQTYLGVACNDVHVVSPTTLTCVTRGNVQRGTWNLTVTTGGGTSAITSADQFTYYALFVTKISPSSGPAGTRVTIAGYAFATGAVVLVGQGHGAGPGALQATLVKVMSPNEITAVMPKGAKSGTWNVFVVEPGGVQTPPHPADRFTYT